MQWRDIFKQTTNATAAPTTSLITLDELKKQCRIVPDATITDEDTVLTRFSLAAEKMVEELAEISIREKSLTLEFACWPSFDDYLILPLEIQPIKSVTHVKYYDASDVQQTLSSTLYEVWLQSNPPSILIGADDVPTLSTSRSKAAEIAFVAGNNASVPINAELAIVELVAFWFQNRESFGKPMPSDLGAGRTFYNLIDSLKWRAYP